VNCISGKFLKPSPLGFISPFSRLLGAREFLREMDHFMVWLPHPLLIHAEFETLSTVAASSIALSLAYALSQSARNLISPPSDDFRVTSLLCLLICILFKLDAINAVGQLFAAFC
jgi:hypothetical protein